MKLCLVHVMAKVVLSAENYLVPYLTEHMNPWKRYVDDTISIIKETSIAQVLTVLNNFQKIKKITYEMKENGN